MKTPGKFFFYTVPSGEKLEDWLAKQLPGCQFDFVEIEDEKGAVEVLLEIGWKLPKKKKPVPKELLEYDGLDTEISKN